MKSAWIGAAVAAVLLVAPAAAEDGRVKAGVDAWANGDYTAAVAQWRAPAEAGDPDAEFNLGQAYKLGRGVPTDLNQAEQWYRKAAVQGHPQAEDNYGLALYQNGKRAEAVQWLQRSARRGEPRAQFVLGTMYFNGEAVTKDWVRAYALMVRASASGLSQATVTLGQMDRYVAFADRQQGRELADRYAAEEKRPQPPVQLASDAPARPTQIRPAPAPSQSTPIPAPGTIVRTDLPPSNVYHPSAPPEAEPVEVASAPPAEIPAPAPRRRPRRPAPVEVASADMTPSPPAPAPAPAPAVAPVRGGGWKLQLGAFGDPGNARKLWSQVGDRFPGRQVAFVKSGSLTKVLVGPYGSGAEANAACHAVRPCIPVAP